MLQYKQNFYEMRNFPCPLKDYEPRIAKSALHRKEEHVKQVFRDQVAEAAGCWKWCFRPLCW